MTYCTDEGKDHTNPWGTAKEFHENVITELTSKTGEKLAPSINRLDKTMFALIETLDDLHESDKILYEKFEVSINSMIDVLISSLDQLSEEIIASLEAFGKLLQSFLERGNKND